MNQFLRKLPKIDLLVQNPLFKDFNRPMLMEAARRAVESERINCLKKSCEPDTERIINSVQKIYSALMEGTLKKVVNATGVTIHTNLGRAPIPPHAFEEAKKIVCGYSNIEYDTEKGKRGDRYHHAALYIEMLTGAEDAVIVNNNASAVFLVLNTFSNKKETIISRGELVEIGGSFRIPDVMKSSGAKMVETGTTNKTRISDYTNLLTPKTAMFMKVHKSNYEISGFTEEASLAEIAAAAGDAGVLSYYDAGSGLFSKIVPERVCDDTTIADNLKTGIDIISFSGDKMLGGCQAGIIAGKKELISKIKKNPLMRMLRVDKITLAVMQSVLKSYITGRQNDIPVNYMLSGNKLKEKAEKLQAMLSAFCKAGIIITKSSVGGGSCPIAELESLAVEIDANMPSSKIDKHLRNWKTPIIARVSEKISFDVRTVSEEEFNIITDAVKAL